MTIDIERIKQIRHELDMVAVIVDIPAYPTDKNRKLYFYSELDSLMSIISLANNDYLKESFIIIRSIFEKFLYFWLMFKGTKYKWTQPYKIELRMSSTPSEARDNTIKVWQGLKQSGDPKFASWEVQKGPGDDVILLTFQEEGPYITRNGKLTNEIVPIYNQMLDEYEPDIKHLSNIENKINSLKDRVDISNLTSYQNRIYNHYIYITNVFRNLKINDLVNQFQLDIIRIHYNYLSKYVHPTKYSLELQEDQYTRDYNAAYGEKQGIKELVLFYCVKLIQLYLEVFILGYRDTKQIENYKNFQSIVNELGDLSKEFWFFDNEPTEFDLKYSESVKQSRKALGKTVPIALIYNENPVDRLVRLRNYRV